MKTADGDLALAEYAKRKWAAEAAVREFERVMGSTDEPENRSLLALNNARLSIDLLRCGPTKFLEALKARSVLELGHLANELSQRNRLKRAALVKAYAAVVCDFEGPVSRHA